MDKWVLFILILPATVILHERERERDRDMDAGRERERSKGGKNDQAKEKHFSRMDTTPFQNSTVQRIHVSWVHGQGPERS